MFIKKIKTKKGMSLMEVIVAIGIFSLIMVGITQLFVTAWKNQKNILETSSASIGAYQGVNRSVDNIRKARQADNGAYPIQSAGDFDLIIFSDIDKDGTTEKVHYYLQGEQLLVGTSEPSGFPLVYPVNDTEVSVVAENVVNDGGQPIFYYYDETNAIIGSPSSNLADIRMIRVSLIVARKIGNITMESYVSLRNLSEYDRIE